MSGEIGFRNGDLVARNISFNYLLDPQVADPGLITADAQLLIGSITTDPTQAMLAGFLTSTGRTISISYDTPNINIESMIGGGTLSTLTPDVGGVVNPVGNNINVKGLPILAGQTRRLQTETTNVSTVGNPVLQIKAPNCALFIVDNNAYAAGLYSTHITIQSAIDDAASLQVSTGVNQTIFIRPGVYTENLTMAPGINLAAYACDSRSPNVSIIGKVLINAAGPNAFTGLQIRNNGDYAIAVTTTGASPTIDFVNCFIIATNFNAIFTNVNCLMWFLQCQGDILDGVSAFCTLNAGTVNFQYCRMFNVSASSGVSTISNANISLTYTSWNNRVQTLPGSSFGAGYSNFRTGGLAGPILQFNATIVSQIRLAFCNIDSQNQVAIDVGVNCGIILVCCTIDCFGAASITGLGGVNYTLLQFSNTASPLTISNQTPTGIGPRISVFGQSQIISGAGNPNGSVVAPQGSIWLRTDAGAAVNNRTYVNTNNGTGWTAFLTVS